MFNVSLDYLFAFILFFINVLLLTLFECVLSAPVDSGIFVPSPFGKSTDSGASFVHCDDERNVYFDIYAIKGDDNRIMSANNGVLVVSIGPTDDIRNTAEYNLWKFIATVLGVDMAKFEILLFPGEIGRRVLLRNGIMSKQECTNKIKEYLQPYVKGEVTSTSQALLFPHTPLAVYAHNDTAKSDNGQWKYYEKNLKKDEETSEKSLSKRLLEMKPYYEKDPSLMAKVFRDLGVQKEVTFRGRLVPGSPVKPVLDDYRGQKKLKVVRRILEGTDRSVKYPKSKMRMEMSHPVPDLIMLDYLSPDKQNVVSRRVVNILYRNATVDLVEELEYTEVV